MSLIVLPGAPAADVPLAGRALMLNTEKQPRFQCFGFSVTRNSPIQIVPQQHSAEKLREALNYGVLIDITGQEQATGAYGKMIADIDKAIKAQAMSVVKEGEEIGPKVIIGTDSKGQTYVITPKDQAEYERMQEEIRTTGTLRVEKPKPQAPNVIISGLSSIYTEDIETLDANPGE